VSSTLPLAGVTNGLLMLAIGSGMSRSPLLRAAKIIARHLLTFVSRFGHGEDAFTTMPASGGPPPFASNIAYSPCQLSVAPSFTITSGLRSSTGKSPCGREEPASMFSVQPHAPSASARPRAAHNAHRSLNQAKAIR
jgi:hypothetical protein